MCECVSEGLLFNTNSTIFSAISSSWQEQIIFKWDNDEVCFVLNTGLTVYRKMSVLKVETHSISGVMVSVLATITVDHEWVIVI
jgi:hypothetical protein